jgi:peptide-methionine (S)-S-oxide reductase
MTLRLLTVSLGLVVALGFAGNASSQETKEATKEKPKAKAASNDAKADTPKPKLEKATFGGGCFWCQEAVFERVRGVKSVVSGYAGGNNSARPFYEMVGTGMTGHAEVVQIEYDPAVVSYNDLLKIFWASHDPTTLNRQGPDEGTQYRSIILYHNEEQKLAAQKSYEEITAAHVFPNPIVTQLVTLKKFFPAERYHQDYFRRHRNEPYCQAEIVPKLQKLKQKLESAPRSP